MLNLENIEKVQTIYGSFFAWENDLITKQLKQYSAHTRNELAMLKSLVEDEDNILDIGAHIGTFSIPFAKFNGGKGKVFSFEANPDNYELLKRNILENGLDGLITPIHALISTNNHSFNISLPTGGNSGMYYFLPSVDSIDDGINVINIDQWYREQEYKIKIRLIKVDVEGAEVLVLQSCQELINRFKPILYIEIGKSQLERFGNSSNDIENILKPYGYHYFCNIGPRNSNNDNFKIARLNNINWGGSFFDLLAVHPSDPRYPKNHIGRLLYLHYRIKSLLTILMRRFTKRFFRFIK